MIPPLDENGLLPKGQWDCSLPEVETVFCTNPHRCTLWDGLQQFISKELRPRGAQCLWINGSFTRSKSVPADIDIVIDICDWDEPKALELMLHIFLRHDAFKSAYHVDAHVRHPSIPNDLGIL